MDNSEKVSPRLTYIYFSIAMFSDVGLLDCVFRDSAMNETPDRLCFIDPGFIYHSIGRVRDMGIIISDITKG